MDKNCSDYLSNNYLKFHVILKELQHLEKTKKSTTPDFYIHNKDKWFMQALKYGTLSIHVHVIHTLTLYERP